MFEIVSEREKESQIDVCVCVFYVVHVVCLSDV